MQKSHLIRIEKDTISLCLEVGDFLIAELDKVSNSDIEIKDVNSLVSYVDKKAEEQLVVGLSIILPDSGFQTEEDTKDDLNKEYTWIIDPLDGTNNYLHQIPHFAISIALEHEGEVLLGIVYDPVKKECFSAIKGNGAFLNGRPIHVSEIKTIEEAILATGFPYTNDYSTQNYVNILIHWLTNSRGIRRLGSAALDLVYVACGRFDFYYEAFLNPWDVKAGILIVREAGGKVSDFLGSEQNLNGTQTVSTNSHLHWMVLNTIQKYKI